MVGQASSASARPSLSVSGQPLKAGDARDLWAGVVGVGDAVEVRVGAALELLHARDGGARVVRVGHLVGVSVGAALGGQRALLHRALVLRVGDAVLVEVEVGAFGGHVELAHHALRRRRRRRQRLGLRRHHHRRRRRGLGEVSGPRHAGEGAEERRAGAPAEAGTGDAEQLEGADGVAHAAHQLDGGRGLGERNGDANGALVAQAVSQAAGAEAQVELRAELRRGRVADGERLRGPEPDAHLRAEPPLRVQRAAEPDARQQRQAVVLGERLRAAEGEAHEEIGGAVDRLAVALLDEADARLQPRRAEREALHRADAHRGEVGGAALPRDEGELRAELHSRDDRVRQREVGGEAAADDGAEPLVAGADEEERIVLVVQPEGEPRAVDRQQVRAADEQPALPRRVQREPLELEGGRRDLRPRRECKGHHEEERGESHRSRPFRRRPFPLRLERCGGLETIPGSAPARHGNDRTLGVRVSGKTRRAALRARTRCSLAAPCGPAPLSSCWRSRRSRSRSPPARTAVTTPSATAPRAPGPRSSPMRRRPRCSCASRGRSRRRSITPTSPTPPTCGR